MAATHGPSSAERVKNFLWFAGIAILIALAIILWIRKATTPAPSILEKTTQEAEQRRVARVIEELQAAAALTQDPDEKRRREGLTKIEQLAQQNPTFIPAQQALVQAALLLNENALADRVARDLTKQHPNAPEAHTLLAQVAMNTQQLPEAEAEIRKAIELNKQRQAPPSWYLHALLAEALLKQGKVAETDAELRQVSDINLPQAAPVIARTSVDLSERLGIVLLQGGKPQELEPAYLFLTGVAKQKTNDADAQYYAAVAALRRGRPDEAGTLLAAAEKLKPGDPRFAPLRAEIARAPTTTRASSAPATRPTTAPSMPAR